MTYGKRYVEDQEEPRIDFGFFNERSEDSDAAVVLEHLRRAIEQCDAVIFNQQVPGGLSEAFIGILNELFDEDPRKIVLCDARHYGARFKHVYRKTNDIEAARLSGVGLEPAVHPALPELEACAARLYEASGKPRVRHPRRTRHPDRGRHGRAPRAGHSGARTDRHRRRGRHGHRCARALPGRRLLAGGGRRLREPRGRRHRAEGLPDGNGLARGGDRHQRRHRLRLSAGARRRHPHRPLYVEGTEIEACCRPLPRLSRVRHAVFDHDGTISTLRQGWERIMEPMMIRAILGERYASADETLYHRVVHRVRDYIDKSTGIETLVQMAALVDMVREFGDCAAARDILDTAGYKAIYNDALMAVVDGRLAKFRRGELDIDDLTVKGAVAFLRSLRELGVTLYLASGTDDGEVRREADALGYASLFDGGIYGALDRAQAHAKRRVIQRILGENGLDGSRLAVFGDGPVELREARKRHGAAVGVASDEVRRYGLHPGKRARLIKAGAHLVIPDFSQAGRLLALMRDDDD